MDSSTSSRRAKANRCCIRKLIAREAEVKIMASGDVEVHAKEKLVASVYGSGEVRYAGSPASVSKTVRGSGSIEAVREK